MNKDIKDYQGWIKQNFERLWNYVDEDKSIWVLIRENEGYVVKETKIDWIELHKGYFVLNTIYLNAYMSDFGKWWFLDEESAKKKLEEINNVK